MPLTLATVDRSRLTEDLNQLWAEALHRYKQGEKWWHEREDAEMVELFAEQTRERQTMNDNGAMFKVTAWIEENRKDFYTNNEINTATGNYNSPLFGAKSYDLRQVLIQLGYVHKKHYVMIDGKKEQARGYFKELPPAAPVTPKSEKFDAAFNAIFANENR
jgi:Virulence-associated protein E